jgi:biotin transport system substrate-specific component
MINDIAIGQIMLDAKQHVLMDALWAKDGVRMRPLVLVFAGSLLLTLSAKFQVPFYPVPMTLQPLVVLLLGVAFGSRLGLATVLFYLAQGAAGLPVFAGTPEKGIGLAYMVGPTGGYLLGFAVAAFVTGWLAERGFDRTRLGTLTAMGLGMAVIYALGLLWLGVFVGYNANLLTLGFTPFILGDLLKVALATLSLPMLWSLLDR